MSSTNETDDQQTERPADGRALARLEESAVTDSGERAVATTPREEAALRRVRVTAHLLDDAVRIPGTNARVGIDPLLGVLPVGGDTVAAALSLYPVVEAYRFDLPALTLVKMLVLVAIDAVVGSVPVLGTVFDAFWKANEWNRRTLERHLGAD